MELFEDPESPLLNVTIVKVESTRFGRLYLTAADGRRFYLAGGYDGEVEVEEIYPGSIPN